jgi:uncharacterized protein
VNPSVRYVGPFVAFLGLLALMRVSPLPELAGQALFLVAMAAIVYFLAWPVVSFKVERWGSTVGIGVAVFLIWIAPDAFWPEYRHLWLFENSIMGKAQGTLTGDASPLVLLLRSARAVLIVPVIEELFWRAWMMRWLISPDFEKVPLGAWSAQSFWVVALLFASEHGPFWDVGLVAGILYNWWMIRTRSLGDLILAHAVTNACLCGYVVAFGRWEYWL